MDEEKFVIMVREIENLVSSSMNSAGTGLFLAIAKGNGEVEPYLHTIILSVLGILIDEEVI